jgi:hypothetical protein
LRAWLLSIGILSYAGFAPADDKTPVTITMTKDDLEKLIDARIAKAAAASATPTVGDGQTDVKSAFGFGDFSWMPGNAGSSDRPLTWGPLTGELRVDTAYHYEFSNPKDHTISGSSEAFRSNELQVTMLGFGGDFLYKNVQVRLMTQFGMYSQTTSRGDATSGAGQWDLTDAYRYISEGYAGYHIPVMNGINIQAGLFLSYIGMWSYYNYDNWTYQPSFVSQNTPWYFDGVRVQIFPSEKLKIEPWIVNGWESYGKANEAPGLGVQVQWRPTERLAFVANQYGGSDTLGIPGRIRIHSDDSMAVRWYRNKGGAFSQGAVSVTLDAGCEAGGGTHCTDQYFLGFMTYLRFWFLDNHIAATVGGGGVSNPGRYAVLTPPINGATAFTGVTARLADGAPAFTTNVGDPFHAWDTQATVDYMPSELITFRFEYVHRAASIPYFAGSGGMTPCVLGVCSNQGPAGSWPGQNGQPTVAGLNNPGGPDLAYVENRLTLAMMMKF